MRTPERTDDDVRVTLSTLHGVMGLEFDTVVIVGFDAEHLPHRRTRRRLGRRQRGWRGGTPTRLRRYDSQGEPPAGVTGGPLGPERSL